MALKITPAITEAGIDFDHLHLRTSVNSAPENDASPFGLKASFRVYKKNGDNKLFAPTDKINLLKISISDIEKKATEFALAGRLEDAQVLANAINHYEQALALLIMEEYPNLTVEVV